MRNRHALTLAAFLCTPALVGAQAFDFEGTPIGNYPVVTVTSGTQTLTVTPAGFGLVGIGDFAIATGLGTRSAIGTGIAPPFGPLRFSFLQPVGSITFAFGDFGGDDDSPARIEAFDAASASLGVFDTPYPSTQTDALTRSLTFGGSGAAYFVLSSGGSVTSSISWEVTASTIALRGTTIPEPSTWALLAGGLAALAAVAARRKRTG